MLKYSCCHAGMAQLVEQRIRNAQAVGSSPTTSSTETRKASRLAGFLLFRSLSAGLDLSFVCRSSPSKPTPCSPARQTGTRTHCQTLLSAPDGNPPSGAFFGGFARGNPGPGTPGPVAGMISQYRKMSKKGLTNAKSGIIITIPHELNIHINFYYIII